MGQFTETQIKTLLSYLGDYHYSGRIDWILKEEGCIYESSSIEGYTFQIHAVAPVQLTIISEGVCELWDVPANLIPGLESLVAAIDVQVTQERDKHRTQLLKNALKALGA